MTRKEATLHYMSAAHASAGKDSRGRTGGRSRLLVLLLVVALQLGSSHAAATGGGPPRRTRLIVKTRSVKGKASALAAGQHGMQFRNRVNALDAAVYTIEDGADMDTTLEQLRQNADVEWAYPDSKVHVQATPKPLKPNDPKYKDQWFFPKMGAPQAWATLRGKPAVKVCHTDSGVRKGHQDLQAAVAMGWNYVHPDQDSDAHTPVLPTDPAFKDYNDTYGHGTMTGGLIAAVTNNKKGVAGAAFGIKLLVCRFIYNDGSGWVSDAINCWSLCQEQGATIYSNSWGDVAASAPLKLALLEHQKKGHLMVIAAGNSGANLNSGYYSSYPASYHLPCQINVAASDPYDDRAYFSNYGNKVVDLAAPGTDMMSTTYDGGYSAIFSPPNGRVEPASGTSFATPLVSATAALLQSKALEKNIVLNYKQLKSFILTSVDRPVALRNLVVSNGRLNMTRCAEKFNVWYAKAKKQPKPSPSPKPAGRRLMQQQPLPGARR